MLHHDKHVVLHTYLMKLKLGGCVLCIAYTQYGHLEVLVIYCLLP